MKVFLIFEIIHGKPFYWSLLYHRHLYLVIQYRFGTNLTTILDLALLFYRNSGNKRVILRRKQDGTC